ncbi:MAG: NlpC/P60 family protein [Bacteroidota bacterium]
MTIYKIINYLCICWLSVVLLFGCGASSSSPRFNQSESKKESKESSKSSVRFSSSDTLKSKKNTIAQPDFDFPEIPDSALDEFDEVPVETEPVDKSKFIGNLDKLKSYNFPFTSREKILFEIIKFLDTPYKYGGNTENGIDCSAFTKQVFQNSVEVELPRSTREQFKIGENISKYDLKFGDLIYFNTTKRSYPGHVGIYLGDDQFVHASRSLGVIVSNLNDPYYKKRFIGARRVDDIEAN